MLSYLLRPFEMLGMTSIKWLHRSSYSVLLLTIVLRRVTDVIIRRTKQTEETTLINLICCTNKGKFSAKGSKEAFNCKNGFCHKPLLQSWPEWPERFPQPCMW